MGIFGDIGSGFAKAGRFVGDEVGRVFAPIGSAIEGDYRGALSGLGRNIKRASQVGALGGANDIGGIDVDVLGAVGGGVEGALGPSDLARQYFGDTGDGGFAGAVRGGAGGYAGVQAGKGLHNIGERLGINKRLGALTNKVGLTSPDPSMRLEGETDETFVDRVQRQKYDEQMSSGFGEAPEWDPSLSDEQNFDNRNFARRQGRIEGLANVVKEDPRTIKIGEQYYGGSGGPGDLSPGSGGSNFIDRAIGEETAKLDKWNQDPQNVPNVDPQTGMGLGDRLPQTPPGASAGNMPSQLTMAEAEQNRSRQSQGGFIPSNVTTTPSVPAQAPMDFSPANQLEMAEAEQNRSRQSQLETQPSPSGYMTPPQSVGAAFNAPYNVPYRDMSSQLRSGLQPSREINMYNTGRDTQNIGKNLFGRVGDYLGDNPDVLVNALGQTMTGLQQGGLDERMVALREQQQAYDQDRERLREQFLFRGSNSRWA
jgi:hypothetical protein